MSPPFKSNRPPAHPPLHGIFLFLTLLTSGCGLGDSGGTDYTEQTRSQTDAKTAQLIVQGDRALQAGQYRTALVYADSATHRMPENPDALYVKGLALVRMGQYAQADSVFTTLLRNDPSYRPAWFSRGNATFSLGNYQKAARSYYRAYELQPGSNVLLNLGRTYTLLGKQDSAEWAFQESLADSAQAITYMRLGQLYEDQGNYKKALETSRKGYRMDPDNMRFRYAVGYQYLVNDSLDRAIEYLHPVTQKLPWHHRAHYNLGKALSRIGRKQQAQQYLNRADSLRTLHARVDRLRKRARSFPDRVANWAALGDAERKLGRYDRAIEAYQRAIALEPSNLRLHHQMALLQMENGDPEQAIKKFRAILQVDDQRPQTWLNFGVALIHQGDTAGARRAWNRVLELEPNHRQAQRFLAALR